jgi:hypothetical protein
VSAYSPIKPAGRRFDRRPIRCPARVMIGRRQYAGFVENASEGGVKICTHSTIVPHEKVVLHLPDLPPIRAQLRWSTGHEAGIAFPFELGGMSLERLMDWLEARTPRNDLGGGPSES